MGATFLGLIEKLRWAIERSEKVQRDTQINIFAKLLFIRFVGVMIKELLRRAQCKDR